MAQKIYFITSSEPGYSRSWNYFSGLKKSGYSVEFVKIERKCALKNFLRLRSKSERSDVFLVMSPSHYLVPLARILLGRNTYLDAGWSLFESSILTRKQIGIFGQNLIKIYLVDFIASLFAKKIFLESEAQKVFYSKLLFVKRSKCSVIYTGVDEDEFKINYNYHSPEDLFDNGQIVLFRGKYTREAGLEILALSSFLLSEEKITFWIFSPGLPWDLEFSKNSVVVREFIDSKQNLAKIYADSKLTLGQLSDNPRLLRTIPHKAFESAFCSKPYLSARNRGILEVFSENTQILCFSPGDPNDLANKIKAFFTHTNHFKSIGDRMHLKYDSDLAQSKLAARLLKIIEESL